MVHFFFAPKTSKAVIVWLWGVFALVLAMIMLGGATRLTRSGLSITEWKPITGIIPPLSVTDWLKEFALYQQSPEYKIINNGMTLSEFKSIFFMEYSHRLLGRILGLYVLLPTLFFWYEEKLNTRLKKACLGLLALIGLQGFLGWYMVQSGLVDNPHVSPYRLSIHLLTAFSIIALLLSSLFPKAQPPFLLARSLRWSRVNLLLILAGVFYGALVAGHKAGLMYNTFPLMDGHWIPAEVFDLSPWWCNFFENHALVQFMHRILAFSILLSACVGVSKQWVSQTYMVVVLGQLCLGVLTLLYHVPVLLGTLHQGWAVIVFSVAYWCNLKHKYYSESSYLKISE